METVWYCYEIFYGVSVSNG